MNSEDTCPQNCTWYRSVHACGHAWEGTLVVALLWLHRYSNRGVKWELVREMTVSKLRTICNDLSLPLLLLSYSLTDFLSLYTRVPPYSKKKQDWNRRRETKKMAQTVKIETLFWLERRGNPIHLSRCKCNRENGQRTHDMRGRVELVVRELYREFTMHFLLAKWNYMVLKCKMGIVEIKKPLFLA